MTATLWVCRVGAAKYPDLDSLHFGYAGIGWITNRAVMDFPTRKELYNGITRFDSESDHKQGVKVLWNFAHEMRIGDTLVFPYFYGGSKLYAVGRVIGDYTWNPNHDDPDNPIKWAQFRKVDWHLEDVPRSALGQWAQGLALDLPPTLYRPNGGRNAEAALQNR